MTFPQQTSRRASLYGMALILTLAFGLRLIGIDQQSIWWDEAWSLHVARLDWLDLLIERAGNVHPPLYFMLLKVWLSLTGRSIFAARVLALLGSLPGVALAYGAARRWISPAAGLITAGMLAIASVFVIFAQDVRAYAFLPVIGLLLLNIADRLQRQPQNIKLWTLLAVIEAAAFLTHYQSILVLVFLNARLIWQHFPQRGRIWQAWLASQIGAALLALPWVLFVMLNAPHTQSQFTLDFGWVNGLQPPPLLHVLKIVWLVFVSGHIDTEFFNPFPLLITAVTLWLIASLIGLFVLKPDLRKPLLARSVEWMIGIGIMLPIWAAYPVAHPRYVLIWSGVLWVWIGILIALTSLSKNGWTRAFGGLGAVLVVALQLTAGYAYHTNPALWQANNARVAGLISQRAQTGDVVIVPWQDYTFDVYVPKPALPVMIDFRDQQAAWQQLSEATAGAKQVFVIEPDVETRDPLNVAHYALERAGNLKHIEQITSTRVFVYSLDSALEIPILAALNIPMGPATLTGLRIDPAASDNALTVALAWGVSPHSQPLSATLRLEDLQGNLIAQIDRLLLDSLRRPSTRWDAADEVTNFYILPLPFDTPPVAHKLLVGIIGSPDAPAPRPVGTIILSPPSGHRVDLYGGEQADIPPLANGMITPTLFITHASIWPQSVHPGESLSVLLRWNSSAPQVGIPVALRLTRPDGTTLDFPQQPAGGLYPLDHWPERTRFLDRRHISLPLTERAGTMPLTLLVGDRWITLGSIEVVDDRLFEAPESRFALDVPVGAWAKLIGYDVSATEVVAGDILNVSLIWQALTSAPINYKVFVHLVDSSGAVIAQHDSQPEENLHPFMDWINGEYIMDHHPITIPDNPALKGTRGWLVIGLYDPDTMQRLPLAGSDSIRLEQTILFK